jgi:HNH endonuclease
MGPITRLALIGFACLVLLMGGLGVRACYRFVFAEKTPPSPASVSMPANPEPDVQEWADPIAALSSLTNFQKLSTLDTTPRAVNPRVKKILYWLYVAEKGGTQPEHAIDQAFASNGNVTSRKSQGAKAQTMANYRTAKLWGMFTAEALPKLKRGEAVQIVRGTYTGQFFEIDHIVPVARYPQFANELANLQLLPQSQNRSKGDRMGEVENQKLQELFKVCAPATIRQN